MFIGTIPTGLATIINGCLVFGIPRFGDGIVPIAEALWLTDVAMTVGCGVLIPIADLVQPTGTYGFRSGRTGSAP